MKVTGGKIRLKACDKCGVKRQILIKAKILNQGPGTSFEGTTSRMCLWCFQRLVEPHIKNMKASL